MLNAKARDELNTFTRRLRGWKSAMPDRAARFHTVCAELDSQIQALLERRFAFWISAGELDGLRQRITRLGGIADSLKALALAADNLAKELRALDGRLESEAELIWLKALCRDWSIQVKGLASTCDCQDDLLRDEPIFERVQKQLRSHEEALHWLNEARSVLHRLGSNVETATLEADLPRLTRCLEEEGVSEEWLAEIKELLQPLQESARRPRPPSLQRMGSILAEIRGWTRELGEGQPEAEELRRSHRQMEHEWRAHDLEELEELKRKAEQLLDELLEKARTHRTDKVESLQKLMLGLFRACGHQPEMEDRLSRLMRSSPDRPHLHKDWMGRFDEVREYFQAIANNHEMELERRYEQLAHELKTSIKTLRASPLSDELRRQLGELDNELAKILDHQRGVEGLLRDLPCLSELQARLRDLDHQAGQDIEHLSQLQKALSVRNANVQREARRFGIELKDLAPRIEDLGRGSDKQTLEHARSSAEALEQQLVGLERRLVMHCRELLDECARAVEAGRDALEQADCPTPPSPSATIADDADPHQAAETVAAWEGLYQTLLEQAKQAVDKYEQRRLELVAELGDISPDSLGPAARADAERLVRELSRDDFSAIEDPLIRLMQLSGLVRQGEGFFERLLREPRRIKERLDRLRGRLRLFKDEQPDARPEELVWRVTDLVYGIPDEPQQWNAVQHQLEYAETLLERLEIQARKQAARQVEHRVKALGEWLDRHAGATSADTVSTLLDEVKRLGAEQPVPAPLRRRLDSTWLPLRWQVREVFYDE